MEKITEIAKANQIIVVEDGAHFFESGQLNTDYRLLSFGREKDISCVSGGALLWKDTAPGLEKVQNASLQNASRPWTFRHAIQPLILALSLPWWRNGGRFVAGIFSKIKVLPRAVTNGERIGINDVPQTNLPRTQQKILARAFQQRNSELSHRESLANIWKRKLSALFPEANILIPKNFFRVIVTGIERETVLKMAKQNGFDLNEWDGDPIAPRGVDLQKFGYQKGQCPNAEHFIKNYVTFPTNRRTQLADIERFLELFESK
jgi:dTDP-4-amino-4,6-dideoxygalactose transaminase